MCEPASVVVEQKVATPKALPATTKVSKKAHGAAGLALPKLRIYFQVNEQGWAEHHSPILAAAHLKTTNYVKLVVPNGDTAKGIVYESALPSWFADNQAAYEKQIKTLFTKVNKMLPAANKRVSTAKSVYDKALTVIAKDKTLTVAQRATKTKAAAKKLETSITGAFATIHKIPGFVK